MKKLSVKTKFQFGAGCILFLYCVTAATIAYHFLKDMVEDEINDSDRQPSHAPSQGPRHGVFILGLTFLSHRLFAVSGRPLAATLHIAHERDLILADEKRFAAQASARVIDKPRLDVWMILIPVFFLNPLNQVERDFDTALKPHLETSTDDVNGIIKLMEERVISLRRQLAEEIFP